MPVEVEPAQPMNHDCRDEHQPPRGITSHKGDDGCERGGHHQGNPHTVQWAEHSPQLTRQPSQNPSV